MIDEKSIAVLPFDNMSSDPENEYFSDGMSEEIINALSRIEGLKVTARTSSFVFKNQKADVRKIGQELGVSLVLEGSVRKAGDRLRITAQLIRTEDGFHIWSENFDRQLLDVFALQDEVSLLIADKIREHFGHFPLPDHLVDAPTKNMEAYQYYLKGRYYHNKWSMEGFRQAAEYYQQSIARDPNFALPYFGAGLSYSFLGSWGAMDKSEAFQKVDELFAQGRLLDPNLPYGYFCQAKHLFWGLWEDQKSEALLQKALQANPRDANNNEFMAEILSRQGEFAQAREYIDISLNVSPLAPNHYYSKANIFYLQGQFEEALVVIEKGLSIAADFAILIELKLACLIQLGRKETLLRMISEKSDLLLPGLYRLMYALCQEKKHPKPQEILAIEEGLQRHQSLFLLAWGLFLATYQEDKGRALDQLQAMADNQMGLVINFKYDPFLMPLRSLDGFQELIRKYFPPQELLGIHPAKPANRAPLTALEAQEFAKLLCARMEAEKYYLRADLSLKSLAEKVNLHPNKLSWLLNEKLRQNFYDFVNSYRLKEFQGKAREEKNRHLSILGLAYESGFNSKSVFNDYFKKATGLTPKAWLSQNT